MGRIPVAWFDGALVPQTSAVHSIFDHVVSYGTGVFEGIRAYEEWDESGQTTGRRNIWLLEEHIKRLRFSADHLRMNYSYTDEDLCQATLAVLERNSGHSYIRPVVFRGKGLGVDATQVPVRIGIGSVTWGRYVADYLHNDCASVLLTDMVRGPKLIVPQGQAKSGALYGLWSQEAKARANEAHTSEALLNGYCMEDHLFSVVDGSGMNLCIVEGDQIITPDPDRWNILRGLTLTFLMDWTVESDRLKWTFGDIPRQRLLAADEVFLTGTATEVTPVTLIKSRNGKKGGLLSHQVGSGHAGPITQQVSDVLQRAVHGVAAPYRTLLTPIRAPVSASTQL